MASPYERPDTAALAGLEPLLGSLAEELTALRKRCQRMDSELAEVKSRGGTLAGPELLEVRQRIVDLEAENQELRRRMVVAREQLLDLRSRLVFLDDREAASR